MVDEMRSDALGIAGHPVVRTPNLDRLARQGALFANSYTVAPVCSPARTSVFSGRYAHVHGVTTNEIAARDGEIFLPSVLGHYGYDTAIAGKLHYAPKRFSFGFDEFFSFTEEGPTPERGYNAYLRKKYGSPAHFPIVPGSCPWPDDPLGSDVGIFRYPQSAFETEWITDRSVEYLQRRRASAKPWFLFTSYLKPHSPSVEPERYMEMYDPAALPVPKLPADIHQIREAAQGRAKRRWVDDEKMMRVMSAAYYGAITHIDEQVGRLLHELDRLGMADNTLVLFTADHGKMLGDRGRWFKDVMWEGSSHVPLIWRGPKGAKENGGPTQTRIVENTDLFPSILEAASLPVPDAGVQGRSFLKLIREGDPGWKDHAYAQLATAMVHTSQFKLIDLSRDLSKGLELYDLRNDPREERNLIAEPRHREMVEDLKRRLTAWRADRPAPFRIAGMKTPEYAIISPEERRELIRNSPEVRNAAGAAPPAWTQPSGSFEDRLLPAPKDGGFRMDRYWVWCGSVVRGGDGKYHIFASRWPARLPFGPHWCTNSEIVRGVADRPEGPFRFAEVVLPPRGEQFWDGRMTHNPTIHRWRDRYLLFYIGTTYKGAAPSAAEGRLAGRELWYEARANQRIGLAVAKSVEGPWGRLPEPILQPRPGKWDALMTTNPAACMDDDGGVLLIYKSSGSQTDLLRLGVARADRFDGPYQRVAEEPIFRFDQTGDHVEDAYVWRGKGERGYQLIMKDMKGGICGEKGGGIHARSEDGVRWTISRPPKAYSRTVRFSDGTRRTYGRLERPQLLVEDGVPPVPLLRRQRRVRRRQAHQQLQSGDSAEGLTMLPRRESLAQPGVAPALVGDGNLIATTPTHVKRQPGVFRYCRLRRGP